MAYEVYTYGNGEVLDGVFNAIAMCMNGHTGTLFEPLKRMALILGAFWAAVAALGGDQVRVLTHWIVPMAIFMNVLFVPTTSVWIHDPITHYHQKVDNVPYGLAAFAGYISKIGYHITEEVEKVFTLPDDLRYQKSGFLFASNILQKAKSFHITNADLEENMRSFVGQCVLYDAMLGRKYTIDDLRNTDDIWGLISQNPSPVRSFLWRDLKADGASQGGGGGGGRGSFRARPDIITCAEGVAKINRLWAIELDRSANLFGKKIFGKNGLVNPKVELLKYLPLAYAQLGNIAMDASSIMKQQMMIYAVVEGVEANSTALGNAPNFAARRAYLQQRTTYETLGAMAGETLPIMKAVLEAIVYAFFLFVIPLCLLPSGYRFLMVWGQSLLWLQMWAPLYAVLNYIMTMAARSKTLDALSMSNEAGVTIASSVGLTHMNADITAMAGYLAMSIPFLSLALVKGVGSFVHMASHLGNVSQGSASMAAGEVTSGNLSFGNISEGNSQISNTQMLNHSNAASYRRASVHLQDGRSEITTMADGSQVLNVGTSNLPISLNVAESQSDQLSQMASQSQQKAMNLNESSARHLSSAARNALNLSEILAKMESSGNSANLGITTEQSQAIHHGKNLVKDFVHQMGVEESKAAELLANAAFGNGKGGIGLLSGSVSMGGNLNAKENDLHYKAQKFAEDHNYQEAMREVANASKQLSHNLTNESSRRLAEEISGSYEKGMSQREEASKSYKQAEDYSNQANFTKANSATINANHNQQFGEWLAAQPADNSHGGTIGARGAAYIIAAKPREAMAYAQRYMEEKGFIPTNTVSSPPSLRSNYDNEQGHQIHPVTKEELRNVRNQAGDLSNTKSQSIEGGTGHGVGGIDRKGGKIVTQGMDQGITARPKQAGGEASRFKEEKPLTSTNAVSSTSSLRSSYDQEQSHQVLPVTRETMQNVRNQAGGLSNTKSHNIEGGTRDGVGDIDRKGRQIATQRMNQRIASKSNSDHIKPETKIEASRFKEKKTLTSTNAVSSTSSLRSSYDQEQSHQVRPVTGQTMQNVRDQGDLSNTKSQSIEGGTGDSVRGIDRKGGKIATQGMDQRIASKSNPDNIKPEYTKIEASRFKEEKPLIPINSEPSTPSSKSNYDKQQSHQVLPVTGQSVQNVRNQAGDLSNTQSRYIGGNSYKAGRSTTQRVDQPIAPRSNQAMLEASRFTNEKTINSAHHKLTSETQIKVSNPSQQQVHPAVKDSLQNVSSQGSNFSHSKSEGVTIREKVEITQSQHIQAISTESSGVLKHGAALKKDVHVEQEKGLVRRVGAKGLNEIKKLIPGLGGEEQQK